MWKGCKLSWHVKYEMLATEDGGGREGGVGRRVDYRLRHRLHVHKDDVQAVIPISKVGPAII